MCDWQEYEDVPAFLARDDWEDLIGELSKAQLLLIAEYKGLTIPEGAKKGSILLMVVDALKPKIDLEASRVVEETKFVEKQYHLQEIELAKVTKLVELEKEKMKVREKEREEKQKEWEREREREKEKQKEWEREREREKHEREEKERAREHELAVLRLRQAPRETGFSVGSALKLVPAFDERNVAEFFVAFEKIANRLSWPQEMWTTLLQCRLAGKAQKVCYP